MQWVELGDFVARFGALYRELSCHLILAITVTYMRS
jgi:hypothetical protein